METTLTIKEIEDLATFAGLVINEDNHEEGFYETEIVVDSGGLGQFFSIPMEEGGKTYKFKHIAYFAELKEEGVFPLGDGKANG